MLRPVIAAQAFGQIGDLDPGRRTLRIHLGHGGQKHEMGADTAELGQIAGLVAWVARQILGRRELGRVDEH